MIKMIIFDLDGVLIDARDLHYEALNDALSQIDPKYIISKEDHLSKFDGLPTSRKLDVLIEERGFPLSRKDDVWGLKQEATIRIIGSTFDRDERLVSVLSKLKQEGYKICVASNSIRDTVKMALVRRGFIDYVDFYYSNQDVNKSKPSSEMYLRCMIKAGVDPVECVIVEDSNIGRRAVRSSGAHLCAVRNTEDVTYKRIKNEINKADKNTSMNPKWDGGEMTILVPMAGAGSRFAKAGYTFPKPLIEVKGKPMIQVVVDNLNINAKFVYVVQKSHYEEFAIKEMLNFITPNCEIVQVDGVTEGAACTTLLAKEFINNDHPLLIANSDQFMDWDSNDFMYSMIGDNVDGGILTFKSTHPKWSYVKIDDNGYVTEVAEKKPISDKATVGVYYFSRGSDYVKYAEIMINKNLRVNNEFYVCPVYTQFIEDKRKIKTYDVKKMWGLGTPEDLNIFLQSGC
jgi:HAD superfamily hydrolase (TIGR01509 family)